MAQGSISYLNEEKQEIFIGVMHENNQECIKIQQLIEFDKD